MDPMDVDLVGEGFDEWVAVSSHVAGPCSAGTHAWRPGQELCDPLILHERTDHTLRELERQRHEGTAGHGHDVPAAPGPVTRRVAISATQLGMVARLVVPVIAARSAGAEVGLPGPAEVWWQPRSHAPVPLSFAWRAGDMDVRGSLVGMVTEASIEAGLSPIVAWDNVASAASTSVIMVRRCRPDLVDRATEEATTLLRLVDARPAVSAGPGFRRRSCCLYYRVSGSRVACCGDCVLAG